MLDVLTHYVPMATLMRPVYWTWNHTVLPVVNLIPGRLQVPVGAFLLAALVSILLLTSPDSGDNTLGILAISLGGLVVIIATLWATSKDRKLIQWRTVIVGLALQFLIAFLILRTSAALDTFQIFGVLLSQVPSNAAGGVMFLTSKDIAKLPIFLLTVLPPLIFFTAFTQLVSRRVQAEA